MELIGTIDSIFPFPYNIAIYALILSTVILLEMFYKHNMTKINSWKVANEKLIFRYIIVILTVAIISLSFVILQRYFITASYTTLLAISVGFISSILTLISSGYFERKLMPVSYNVAIVGFPQSGKTTAIISIFGEIFARRILSVKAIPRGIQTIERVNEALELLKSGRAIGPTKDQDRFAFRTDITIKKRLFSRTYKVEFGDFPGEDSEDYSLKYGSWLHNTEYFKWVIDSDAIIFIVDIGRYLTKGDEYVGEMSSALRAAWQHFSDFNEQRMKNVKNMPVVLVFTKADLFGVSIYPGYTSYLEREIKSLGFGNLVHPVEIDPETLLSGENTVKHAFNDIIRYFENESSRFRVLFISSYGDCEGELLGIHDLLKAVLPKFP